MVPRTPLTALTLTLGLLTATPTRGGPPVAVRSPDGRVTITDGGAAGTVVRTPSSSFSTLEHAPLPAASGFDRWLEAEREATTRRLERQIRDEERRAIQRRQEAERRRAERREEVRRWRERSRARAWSR